MSVSLAALASLAPERWNAMAVTADLWPLKLMTMVSVVESQIRMVPSS
jgi:hypothetical protein